jgi:AcrR family transcriptional regulator
MPKVTEQHREARRTQILDAARQCFVRRGFHETSMADLLAEAGLSSGAVYSYFSSKHEMIVAIAEENMSQVVAMMRESAAGPSRDAPGAALAKVLDLIRARHADDGFATIAVLVWSEATRNPALAARLSALLSEMQADFGGLADQLRLPKAVSADSFGTMFASIIAGFILQLAVVGPHSGEEDLVTALQALWPAGTAR